MSTKETKITITLDPIRFARPLGLVQGAVTKLDELEPDVADRKDLHGHLFVKYTTD